MLAWVVSRNRNKDSALIANRSVLVGFSLPGNWRKMNSAKLESYGRKSSQAGSVRSEAYNSKVGIFQPNLAIHYGRCAVGPQQRHPQALPDRSADLHQNTPWEEACARMCGVGRHRQRAGERSFIKRRLQEIKSIRGMLPSAGFTEGPCRLQRQL